MNEQQHRIEGVQLHAIEAMTGRAWDVTIMGPTPDTPVVVVNGREYIRSKNKRLYSVDGLRESVSLWDGVKVYDNHLTDAEFEERGGMRSIISEGIGVLVDPHFDEAARALKATLKIINAQARTVLMDAHEAKVLEHIGLSADTFTIAGEPVIIDGEQWPVMEGFSKVLSLDVVSSPAAGGAFNRLLETRQNTEEEQDMDEKEVKALVAQGIAEALAAQKAEAEKLEAERLEAEVEAEAERVETERLEAEKAAQEAAEAEAAAKLAEEGGDDPEPDPKVEALEQKVAVMECERQLEARLAEAKLPDEMTGAVRDIFAARTFEADELEKVVKRFKEAQAAMDNTGQPAGAGAGGAGSVTMDARDKAEMAFLSWMAGYSGFRGLESIIDNDLVAPHVSEAYQSWQKASKPNYGRIYSVSEWVRNLLGGDPLQDQRAYEAVTTSGMSSIVKNTVNLLVAADYGMRELWYEPIVTTEEVDTIDDATLVRIYGISTLSVVKEGQPYTELAWADDEETATFVKKGNYIGVTLEALMRDKTNKLRSIPGRLANSWFNTLSDLVSGVFTVNSATGPVLGTTGALFNATAVGTPGGHANLGSTALSYTTYDSAVTAMAKQTDQALGVGRRLLVEPKHLLVPVDLRATALQIRNSEHIPASQDNDINPYYNNINVIQVPQWTDTDNWAAVADKAQFPAIYLIFPRGQRTPQLFTADSELGGAMFTNDTLRFKVRMMTYRFSATYECAPVADFRPLYKANV